MALSEEEQRKKFEALELQMSMMHTFMKTLQDENVALKQNIAADQGAADHEESERQKRIKQLQDDLKTIEDEETALQDRKAGVIAKLQQEMANDPVQVGDDAFSTSYDHSGPFRGKGREEKIELTFGNTLSAKSLREFVEHYKLVKMVNIRDQLLNWDDPSFRAAKLRLALRGSAAEYVTGESGLSKPWTEDDQQIIDMLERRYLKTEAIELKIIEVEETKQADREPLPDYLSRVQRMVRDAYHGEAESTLQKRTAWKFLSGIQNKEIRASVIKEKWMATEIEAKTPDEILLIAETARMTMAAVSATGNSKGNVGAFTSGNSGKQNRKTTSKEWEMCLYCKRRHPGGWQDCYRRQREDPNWTPPKATPNKAGKKTKDF